MWGRPSGARERFSKRRLPALDVAAPGNPQAPQKMALQTKSVAGMEGFIYEFWLLFQFSILARFFEHKVWREFKVKRFYEVPWASAQFLLLNTFWDYCLYLLEPSHAFPTGPQGFQCRSGALCAPMVDLSLLIVF